MRHALLPCAILTLALTGCTDKGDGGDDGAGDSGISTENTAPTAPAVTIGPDGARTDADLAAAIVTESTDADGDTVTYTYAWTVDGADAPDHTTATVPSSATAKGQTWAVTVTPDDGTDSGEAGTASITVENTPPVTASASAGPEPATESDTLTCTSGGATDADEDSVTESIAWYVEDVEVGTGETLEPGAFASGESVWCVITPDDGEEAGEPVASNVLVIDNQLPVGDSLTVTPTDVTTDTVVTAEAAGTDPDGDEVTFTYVWTVNGAEAGTEATLDGATAFDKGDLLQVTATPFDGSSEGTPLVSEEITVGNTAPEGTDARLSPADPATGDAIAVEVEGTDADGDDLDWAYTWYIDDVETGITGSTLPASATEKGDEIHVVATPSDDEEAGTSITSDTVTVGNTAPVGTRATLSPTDPGTEDEISLDLEGSDADGDSLAWVCTWYVSGTEAGSSCTSLPASATEKDDEIYVVATPNDGDDAGSPVTSDTVTVGNTAPAATSVTLSASEVGTNDTLVATPVGTDADDDSISWTYAWYVDGTLVSGVTGDSLDGTTWFDKGQEVYVVATPSDGEEDGTSVTSGTADVRNTAPGAPGLAIDPTEPLHSNDLVCTIDSASTDADGDDVAYSFTWTVDGETYTGATTTTWDGDTVPASATSGGEEWVCTVTPSDDEEEGAAASESVTIVPWEGARIFTTCGATGANGPAEADCDAEYSGTTLDGEITVSDGIQIWTAPFDGDFVISAYGAQGAAGDSDYVGGWGALAEGTFTLAEGDVLYIAVGQEGLGQSSGSNGGGGGGSFVVDIDENPLVVAGGGGGTRTNVDQDGCDAVGDEYGVAGSGSSASSSCTTMSSGLGAGGDISSSSWGSGGAGFDSDGESDGSWGDGGSSWANGLTGGEGVSCSFSADGGFGGGGSGNGCYGGGGGGGYSGGEGGRVAGGGGSWVDAAATDVTRTSGDNDGEGWVTIDLAE